MDVAVIDYGTGNLHTLVRALQEAGAAVRLETDLNAALQAGALVLPATGAFGAAASRLATGTVALHQALLGGKPCLAIGLGMHLLFESSSEGEGAGLCVFAGSVERLRTRRVPHAGWNDVEPVRSDPLLDQPITACFSHTAAAHPADESQVLAWTRYFNDRFPAAMRRDNVWGLQFQPEKSGAAGLRVLRRFVATAQAA